MFKLISLFSGFLLIVGAGSLNAEPPASFSIAKKQARKIFSNNRETLYCGCKYDQYNKVNLKSCGMRSAIRNKRANRIEWEHIVPAENIGGHFKCWREKICKTRKGKRYKGRKCCERQNKNFRRAEAELYNLWPAVGLVNAARLNYRYAPLNGSEHFYGCDFKRQGRKVEPRDEAKGIVARASLFMSDRYNIRLSKSQRQLFRAWNKQFKPSKREIDWAKSVQKIEGYSNPYILSYEKRVG